MRVLIVEDEPDLAHTIAQALEENGMTADVALDGKAGLALALESSIDAVVLDLMLPKRPGLAVLKTLRKERPSLPILVLTALNDVDDRIHGLDLGADDYLAKPFALGELLARVRALLRKAHARIPAANVRIGDLDLDLAARSVRRAGRSIRLTTRDYALLVHFVNHRGCTLSRQQIGEAVIDRVFEPQSNLVDVSIHELRSKLGNPPLIHTVRGVGYRFDTGDVT